MDTDVIRAATPDDAAAICAIWNPLILESTVTFNAIAKTEAEIAGTLLEKEAAGHPTLVAEVAGQVAGFGTYGQFRAGVGYARSMEHTVHVAPRSRGTGLGRALVGALADHARSGGAHWLIAGVSGDNAPALRFHAALGFAPMAVLSEVGFKFGRYLDLHLMGLRLWHNS